MSSSLRWRTISMALVIALFGFYTASNFVSKETRHTSFWPDEGLRLGLDLQGGFHLVYGADLDVAVRLELAYLRNVIKEEFEDRKIATSELSVDEEALSITVRPTGSVGDPLATAKKVIADEVGVLELKDTDEGRLTYKMKPSWDKDVRENAMAQVLEVLRRRVSDPINGIQDSVVARKGKDRILVQIPGSQVDRDQIIRITEITGLLEFKLVEALAPTLELLADQYPDGYPEGTVAVVQKEDGTDNVLNAYLVPDIAAVTGEKLDRASIRMDPRAGWVVDFVFDPEGAKLFRKLTDTENRGKQLAIVLDGDVHSAPQINDPIPGGRGFIQGSFTSQEAADLAIILRSGSLAIPIGVEEERSIGPALGADAIRSGMRACMLGLSLVMLFILFYYKAAGAYAGISLLVNMIVLLGIMSMVKATLTLPGIAGLVLTMGMAIDANVIIFERIREELRVGKSPRAAIDTGFSRATWTILDANITTLITAIVLFQYGSGPIKGFAVTLSIGILTSVAAALLLTRLMFMIYPGDRKIAELSI